MVSEPVALLVRAILTSASVFCDAHGIGEVPNLLRTNTVDGSNPLCALPRHSRRYILE